MLAPRKKLWSTPSSAIDIALEFAKLDSTDVVYDVGCGDGRVLIQMSSLSCCKNFVGIEISQERANEASKNIQKAKESSAIPSDVTMTIICANALDTTIIDYSRATVIFLYLVPRGLRLIKDIVWPEENEESTTTQQDDTNDTQQTVNTNSKMSTQSTTTSEEDITNTTKQRRIITYMSPFENTTYLRKEYCKVEHQEGAAWPIFLYSFPMKHNHCNIKGVAH